MIVSVNGKVIISNFKSKAKLKALELLFGNCFSRPVKHYASLHKQDRRIHIFDNSKDSSLIIPNYYKVSTLSDFKIKKLRGGFQRRPELIESRTVNENCNKELQHDLKNIRSVKIRHIQHELVTMGLKLLKDLAFVGEDFSCNESLVLDIGCGDGSSMKPLIDQGYSCIGIDLDLQTLSQFKCEHDRNSSLGLTLRNVSSSNNMRHYSNVCDTHSVTGYPSLNLGGNRLNSSFQCIQTSSKYTSSQIAEVVRWDLRHGLPFRSSIFDFAISISFLQWLFYGKAEKQLHLFFHYLRSVLKPNGKAVIQFYPRDPYQLEQAVKHANTYFQGALIGDYPHIDRGRKLFLLLFNTF